MSDTPNLVLPYLAASQAQKHVTHNEALSLIDGLIQLSVNSRVLTTPPVSPLDGDRYLVATSPTGDWAGQSGTLALHMEGAWRFVTPRKGWRLWVEAENVLLVFNGTAWIAPPLPTSLQNMNLLGVNATADATNKLAVSSSAVLFNNVGNGVQFKVNKNAATDTASILLQTGFSGRAELGTSGDDNLHFKVSADGSAFNESLVVTGASGLATFKNNLLLAPQAVDPATAADGQVWYNSTTAKFRGRQNGANVDLTPVVAINDGDKGDIIVSGSGTVWSLDVAQARTSLAINNLDNTADVNKPVSTAVIAALAAKANLASPALSGAPTAPTPAQGDNSTKLSTTAYVDTAVGAVVAASDAMVFKGVVDCSANPNYPAADRGATYRVSVAGKIGGASGPNVEIGDLLLCITDGTLSGTQAAVGAQWTIAQANIDGAVIGPASASDGNPAVFDQTSGKLIKQVTFAAFKSALAISATDVTGLGALATLSALNLSTQATGTLQATQVPAHTGDVINTAGSLALSIAANAVTNTKLATMAALTVKGNNTGVAANPIDLTSAQVKSLLAIANTDVSGLGTLATQSGTFTGTSSGSNSGDQNVFGAVAVSGQSNVVTSIPADTLTLVAGTNISITTTPAAKSVTISATGSGTVTSASLVAANGFGGAIATPSSTPAITLTTTVTGIVKGNGTALSAAVVADFPTLNQNSTGSAGSVTGTNVVTNANLVQAPSLTLKGNNTGASAAVTDLTTAQVKALLAIGEADIANLVTDLGAKAALASPAFTGTPTAPTVAALNNSTQVATTAYVDAATSAITSGSVQAKIQARFLCMN